VTIDFADPRLWFATVTRRTSTSSSVDTRHIELRRYFVVVAAERRLLRAELDDVVVRLCRRRMIGRRPHRAAPHVAQIDELAAWIARGSRRDLVTARPRWKLLPPAFVTIVT
jgi:hypothetical protein